MGKFIFRVEYAHVAIPQLVYAFYVLKINANYVKLRCGYFGLLMNQTTHAV